MNKYKYLRFRVRIRKICKILSKNINNKVYLSSYEEKGIKLWKLLLRDETTYMSYSKLDIRQLSKGDVFMTFKPDGITSYILTIVNISDNNKSLFELHIPEKYSNKVLHSFDFEHEKRMNKLEREKNQIIETDIDKLIQIEESNLKNKNNLVISK